MQVTARLAHESGAGLATSLWRPGLAPGSGAQVWRPGLAQLCDGSHGALHADPGGRCRRHRRLFGGRLLQAGRDVTFLVRPRRAAELASSGLSVRGPKGDFHAPAPPSVTADHLGEPFDLVLMSCKAYELEGAMEAVAPAVGARTAIIPLLNGMRHIDLLEARFGAAHVLGGQCVIAVVLDAQGQVLHLNDSHLLTFGERDGSRSARVKAIAELMAGARFETSLSEAILQEMWEKWVLIAGAAGITCLMRAAVADIVAAGAADIATLMLEECSAIAAARHSPSRASSQRNREILTAPRLPFTASMLRDIERGARVEADHVIGDLLARAGKQADHSALMRIAYGHLKPMRLAACARLR